jgi:hypothetical protein
VLRSFVEALSSRVARRWERFDDVEPLASCLEPRVEALSSRVARRWERFDVAEPLASELEPRVEARKPFVPPPTSFVEALSSRVARRWERFDVAEPLLAVREAREPFVEARAVAFRRYNGSLTMETSHVLTAEYLAGLEESYVRLALLAVWKKRELFRQPGGRRALFLFGFIVSAVGVVACVAGFASLVVLELVWVTWQLALGGLLGLAAVSVVYLALLWIFSSYGAKGPGPRFLKLVERLSRSRWRRSVRNAPLRVSYAAIDGFAEIRGPGGFRCPKESIAAVSVDGPVVFMLYRRAGIRSRALIFLSSEDAARWALETSPAS